MRGCGTHGAPGALSGNLERPAPLGVASLVDQEDSPMTINANPVPEAVYLGSDDLPFVDLPDG